MIDEILIESRPTLNGVFLSMALIDAIGLLLSPILFGDGLLTVNV